MKIKVSVMFVAAALLAAVTAYSHHSFAGTYILDKMHTIEGKVVQLQIRNPHSFIHVEVVDESGKPIRWSVEGGSAAQLAPQDDKPQLKVGDPLRVTGNPARSAEAHRMRLVRMVRPSDGWNWGNEPGQVVQ